MNSIKYEGNIPKGLRTVCERRQDAIQEVTYHYGWATDTGMCYEVVLRDGWRSFDEIVHSLLDTTTKGMISQIKAIEPCECSDCKPL
jgi:hypothetical protein